MLGSFFGKCSIYLLTEGNMLHDRSASDAFTIVYSAHGTNKSRDLRQVQCYLCEQFGLIVRIIASNVATSLLSALHALHNTQCRRVGFASSDARWVKAMDKELLAIQENFTWDIIF